MYRPFVSTVLSLDSYDSHQTILACMDLSDLSEWPLGRNNIIFLENDYVSNGGISGWGMPFGELSEAGEVVR